MINVPERIQIRIHGVDGSIQTFTQREASLIRKTLDELQPDRLFTQKRITIAGECSLTTFMAAQVTRMDLVTEPRSDWNLAPDLVEAVELSEPAFRTLAQGQHPRERQKTPLPPNKASRVVFDILLAGGHHVFLAQEMALRSSRQNMQELDTLLTTTSLTFPMRTGGFSVLNVANLVCCTVYPDL